MFGDFPAAVWSERVAASLAVQGISIESTLALIELRSRQVGGNNGGLFLCSPVVCVDVSGRGIIQRPIRRLRYSARKAA